MQSRTLQALAVAANHSSFTGIKRLQSIEELTASLMQLDGVGHHSGAADDVLRRYCREYVPRW